MTAVSPMTTPVPWSMKKPFADLRPGECRSPSRNARLRNDARDHCDAQLVELVREPMADDGGEARKAKDDLVDALGGRISGVRRPQIRVDEGAHGRQRGCEFLHDVSRSRRRIDPIVALPFPRERQLQLDLALQRSQRELERSHNKVVDLFDVEIDRAEMPRIKGGRPGCRRSRR